ncbi:hypothetical protein BU23DRAFT_453079 [Bimuria novae-zelandiae CBS 107.79]|uniref:Rhodopsin domain-containing protein n=1 Tax=Bimuria novae-zelandiae CBS 107.79 TaxID=1447943 RepID=A0A6A5VW98_9PLEO|nr:hypothetical protein BU23DRAFT_453079 [Bimuria novae-zelandiae CBS 107.79]
MTVLSAANVGHLTNGYRNRTIIAISMCFPLAVHAVILRFTARRISGAGIWYDDWLACTGLVAVGVFISLILLDLPDDSAIRGEPIPESTLLANAKTVYVAELFYYISQFNQKLIPQSFLLQQKSSILAFYWRLFNVTSIRAPIYLVTCFVVAWFIASFLVTAFQCIPVAALWTPALKSSAKCVELAPFFFGTSIPNILADLLLLALPMPYVWSLKISLTQKICVMGFFLLGGFVLVASAIRLRLLLLLDLQGFLANWSVENTVLWSAMENCIGIVCICLPSLRPVVNLLPWASRFGNSLGSTHASGRDSRFLGTEHGPDKSKQQNDEYELLERDRAGCLIEAGKSIEGHSIQTMEDGSISVKTQIQISYSEEKQPAEAV